MNLYKILSHHFISEDNYLEGEGEQVSRYMESSEIAADTAMEAIEEHYNRGLYREFKQTHMLEDDETGLIYYSTMVDEENMEIQETSAIYNDWVNGDHKLYVDNTEILVYQLDVVKFKDLRKRN